MRHDSGDFIAAGKSAEPSRDRSAEVQAIRDRARAKRVQGDRPKAKPYVLTPARREHFKAMGEAKSPAKAQASRANAEKARQVREAQREAIGFTPRTAAERQRAYRRRKKAQRSQ